MWHERQIMKKLVLFLAVISASLSSLAAQPIGDGDDWEAGCYVRCGAADIDMQTCRYICSGKRPPE
jgi:hypothetical protein